MSANLYNTEIDIWAMGCMIFNLITCQPLFPGDSEGLQLLEQVAVIGFPTEEEMVKLGEVVPSESLDMLKQIQNVHPDTKAINMTHFIGAYINDKQQAAMAANLIDKCLKWVPSERISAVDALSHSFFRGLGNI
jgi:glycogen synthase kinase 3 beta